MNATNTRPSVRLTSVIAALAISLGLVSALSQGMHVERFGSGAPLVTLDPVTVTAAMIVASVEPAVRRQ